MSNQTLFDYMQQQHNVTLLESDMQEIINIVHEIDAAKAEDEKWAAFYNTLEGE